MLFDRDQSMPPPADTAEPCASNRDRSRSDPGSLGLRAPGGEPRRGRTRGDLFPAPQMFPEIHQHVDERVPYRARRGERARMIPLSPDLAPATQGAVDGAREPDGEATDSVRERRPIVRLHHEMEMILLGGKLDDPETGPSRRGEGTAHGRKSPRRPETTNRRHRPQRHVHGVGSNVHGPRAMRHTRPAAGRRLSGTWRTAEVPSCGPDLRWPHHLRRTARLLRRTRRPIRRASSPSPIPPILRPPVPARGVEVCPPADSHACESVSQHCS